MTHPSAAPSGKPPGSPYPRPYLPPIQVPAGLTLARPGQRLLARIIDSALLAIPVVLCMGIVVVVTAAFASGTDPDTITGGDVLLLLVGFYLAMVVVSLVVAAISYLYLVVYQVRTGSTVGKRALRIRVAQLDGAAIDAGSARRRWLASEGISLLALIPGVGMVTGVYNWVDPLWLLWDTPLQQCLHDKYAKTIVVAYEGHLP